MSTRFQKFMFAACIPLAMVAFGGAAVAADQGAQAITDARQEAQISTTYALSPFLRNQGLEVSVKNGTATLTGTVADDVNKELANEIASSVPGIGQVENKIAVRTDYDPSNRSSERSFGEMIDDATITAAVKSKLLWSKYADGLSTNVDTTSGAVTLGGTADSAAAKDLAGRLATNTHGVVSVKNELKVEPPQPGVASEAKDSMDEAGRDIADSWITTKVKSTFLYSSNVNGFDIAVATNKGIVTLSGMVNTGAEKALAIELAQNVRGVNSVDSKELAAQ